MSDIYALSVPAFLRGLGVLAELMRKAEAHATEHKITSAALLTARLFPDMIPLTGQVQIACDTAKRSVARLAGVEAPRFEDDETSFEELSARIQKTIDFVAAQKADAFGKVATVEMKLFGDVRNWTGIEYLTRFALPNFYFHVTTAYDILRHNGLAVGKKDFLGDIA